MRNAKALVGTLTALALALSACSTTVSMRSYPIETTSDNFKRLRIAVPTAGVGGMEQVKFSASASRASASKTVVDAENILAIVQHEVMKSLQSNGKKIALVAANPDLDLQISFQAPAPRIDLISLLTLGIVGSYQSLGGAKLVEVKTGRVLYTVEFVSTVHHVVPPTRIKDWEGFANKLAEEVTKTLGNLKLADHSTLLLDPYLG